MDAPASVVACSNCSALYTAGPGDRGFCADCRRRMPRTPPPSAPMQPLARVTAPMTPPRMTPTDTRRPNFRPAGGGLRPGMIIKGMIIVSVIGSLVWQRQSLSDQWTRLQRHGVAGEWAAIERKASDAWVEIRSRLPLGSDAETTPVKTTSRAHASDRDPTRATRGTHHQAQVAERTTKRKGKTKQREDLSGPGNTP